jgi:aspartate kinase
VTHSTAEARITVPGLPDEPGVAARVLRPVAERGVPIDMIVQDEPASGRAAAITFTVPRDDLLLAGDSLEPVVADLGAGPVETDAEMGTVSVIGAAMKGIPGVAARTFGVLGDARVNIEMISTSPIKISCVVPEERVPDSVRALHDAFALA